MSLTLGERIRGWIQPGRRLNALDDLPSLLSKAGPAASYTVDLLRRIPVILPLLVILAALFIAPIITPPIPCLSEPDDVGAILGTLLTAQAAIAALTLAVTLFMMQGIRARSDVDDRIYREYVRRTWMRDILWGSLLAVGVTGTLLLVVEFVSGDGVPASSKPELRNFVLAAGLTLPHQPGVCWSSFREGGPPL